MLSTLKRRRERFLDERGAEVAGWRSRYFSAATLALWRAASSAMRKHCRGSVLDAGCGRGGWRRTIEQYSSTYESVDVAPRGTHVPTWIADVCDMPDVPANRFDTVVCHQVLEHVSQPWRALAELHRVTKPGGTIILSVPHLNRLHELPHDYFRFTQAGTRSLLNAAGFTSVESLDAYGGLLSFLHHQTSCVIPGLLAGMPLAGDISLALNAPFSLLLERADDMLDRARLFPLGVLAVARKSV